MKYVAKRQGYVWNTVTVLCCKLIYFMMIVHYVMMILCHVIMIVHNVMMIIRNDIMIVYNVMRIVLYVMMVLHFFFWMVPHYVIIRGVIKTFVDWHCKILVAQSFSLFFPLAIITHKSNIFFK